MNSIGAPMNRTDGWDKVSGAARYSAEHPVDNLAHAVLVTSTIPNGRVKRIDSSDAQQVPGLLLVMSHENVLRLPRETRAGKVSPPIGRVLSLLQDADVHYNNQPIAVVVAETFEAAREAAARLRVEYEHKPALLDFEEAKQHVHPPEKVLTQKPDTKRGDLQTGLLAGSSRIDVTYRTPIEHHNPIEPHATIAAWDGEHLTLYDSTQYMKGVQRTVAGTLGIDPENVTVLCPYVGGGFGCKGSVWSHVVLAAMAAKMAGRPVRLVLDRNQMFGPVGQRPVTEQRMRLAAMGDGRLTGSAHDTVAYTSMIEDWIEPCGLMTRMMYAVPNQETSHRLARMHLGTPTFMRAPGEASGSFALESGMDELAHELGIDPLQLRLQNYTERDPGKDLPFSSKSLRQCYEVGAERFGWSRRNPQPRSMREGDKLVGWGMATATYPTNRSKGACSATMAPDGSVVFRSSTQDLGTGTYTVMTQIAADGLGVPVARVRFELGNSQLPEAPVSGGSTTVASVGSAVLAAGGALRLKLIGIAVADERSPLYGVTADEVDAQDGELFLRADPSRREAMASIVGRHGGGPVEAMAEAEPGDASKQFSMHAFGAVFVEVHVDEALGEVRVPRVVGVYGVGKLMNAKTGHSQLMGGIVGGLGMALLEETVIDPRNGRAVNGNLAEYHVPVNADIGHIDVQVVEEEDPHVNPLGAKGIGEIGITGVAAAVANAVYHATGKRIRALPITLDKLL
ncbi:xanthine dehydrogenase family protein molybdopterin-binding subunit [Massilia sp. Dwa41.01b]|uniref:xanthine dehydrogenase family protein molybdopterin-binding subunit n=1 Tax=unclassified Massilia TaxID=2609279 RepID=UPI001601C819|nr:MULTISPECIES: xanthine dehydrogenase family protein molybdopterin-binding subunit [unclassified Massilia]QNA87455.1 xanthine dehydrogenase family protein molybdopterin-binding subunit [Massilia sp. Dwa41.01b]QNA98361.1 xanthine dehydrogenase family protein molybdopterin-binding subunit [Massilia sp. Se16.2.3]